MALLPFSLRSTSHKRSRVEALKGLLLVTAVIAALAAGLLYWSGAKLRRANEIIARIEKYRGHTGHLPDPENSELRRQLGFELNAVEWGPSYQILGQRTYRIVILEGFDGPYWIYRSDTQKWEQGF